uniref:Uncharacterized protein n=1 Tax=Drosophila pseudoobscura pseudoobscura TaxID=46245 RepID=A0A0R3NW81_DROPS
MSICCAKHCRSAATRQTFTFCWLCDNMAHTVCADFGQIGGRVVDLIKTRCGLNWTCWDCRAIENDMRVFMRQTHTEFAARFYETELAQLLNPPLCRLQLRIKNC